MRTALLPRTPPSQSLATNSPLTSHLSLSLSPSASLLQHNVPPRSRLERRLAADREHIEKERLKQVSATHTR